MSCRECGLRIRKGDKFGLVGFYPGFVDKMFFGWSDGLDYYGDLYHEACYRKSIEKQESKQKPTKQQEESSVDSS